jgi:hypothetical protein
MGARMQLCAKHLSGVSLRRRCHQSVFIHVDRRLSAASRDENFSLWRCAARRETLRRLAADSPEKTATTPPPEDTRYRKGNPTREPRIRPARRCGFRRQPASSSMASASCFDGAFTRPQAVSYASASSANSSAQSSSPPEPDPRVRARSPSLPRPRQTFSSCGPSILRIAAASISGG